MCALLIKEKANGVLFGKLNRKWFINEPPEITGQNVWLTIIIVEKTCLK